MDFAYVAYTRDKKMVKGKLSANNQDAAVDLLNYAGYQVLTLKEMVSFFNTGKVASQFSRVKPMDLVMFSRQLALLLESGIDIVTSLELLQNQSSNKTLQHVIGQVVSDIRGGSSLSAALRKHPRAFSELYHRAISAGEQGGNLEGVLRQMADHIERAAQTEKKIKGALTYPIIVGVVAVAVIVLMVTYVLPNFTTLYEAFGTDLPAPTRMLIGMTEWFNSYGLYLGLGLAAVFGSIFAYTRTPTGKYWWDNLMLTLPVIGRIVILNNLARCCRTMGLLFKVGVPLPEIMAVTIYSTTNKVVSEALNGVQSALMRGEGLSRPMSRRKLFLPLMVQMVGVGEETGNLDHSLSTVAQSYETEAEDKTSSAVALIQPIMTIVVGLIVGFIALSLISAMYSIYGQLG